MPISKSTISESSVALIMGVALIGAFGCGGETSGSAGAGGSGTATGAGGGGSNGVPSLSPLGAIKTFFEGACALLGSGEVVCFRGEDTEFARAASGGELGPDGVVRVALPETALDVVAPDSRAHAHCALLEDGTVWCWGRNKWGALGDGSSTGQGGSTESIRSTPQPVDGIMNTVQLEGRGSFACALDTEGVVRCWGAFNFGPEQQTNIYASPVRLDLPGAVAQMSSVSRWSGAPPCFRLRGGSVYCPTSNGFEEIPEAANAVELRNNCAILEDTRAFCWGLNVAEGWGAEAADSGFYPLDDIVDINADSSFSLALRRDGSLWWSTRSNAPSEVVMPCDLTSTPVPKFTRFVGPDAIRSVALFTSDDIMAFGGILQCGLAGFFECEGGDGRDGWGYFGNYDDSQLTFRSDRDALCELSGACCVDGDSCDCLRRGNLCGAPSECDEFLE